MENKQPTLNQAEHKVRNLLQMIQNTTIHLSNTFEQTLRDQDQYLKTYRLKISQLIALFQELTKILEEKFISNTLNNRLEIIIKERDYFKYQCLKLNVQYQTIVEDQKNLNMQVNNVSEQMQIYKHLLEEEKAKTNQFQKSTLKIKKNFNNLAENAPHGIRKSYGDNESLKKQLEIVKIDIKKKNQVIRGLKSKLTEFEDVFMMKEETTKQNRELYEVFRSCMDSWKREIITKERHTRIQKNNEIDIEKVNSMNKKELLRKLFTNPHFLAFLEDLLFNPNVEVSFQHYQSNQSQFINQNRKKLIEFMKKKRIIPSR